MSWTYRSQTRGLDNIAIGSASGEERHIGDVQPANQTTYGSGTNVAIGAPTGIERHIAGAAAAAPVVFAGLTDLLQHNMPAKTLPAKGGTYVDPVFGNTVLRVTDASDGDRNRAAYAYYGSFNMPGSYGPTRLLTYTGSSPYLYDFDPVNFRVSNRRALFTTATPPSGVGALNWEDLQWSGVDPDVILGHQQGPRIWSYNVATDTYTLLANIGTIDAAWANCTVQQWYRSLDDRYASFLIDAGDIGTFTGFGAIDMTLDTQLLKVEMEHSDPGVDEVQLDKSGRYVIAKFWGGTGGVYDLEDGGAFEATVNGNPDYWLGHSDNGDAIAVGIEDFNYNVTKRSLATPHTWTSLLNFLTLQPASAVRGYPLSSNHFSMLMDDDEWVCISMYQSTFTPVNDILEGEIFLLSTVTPNLVHRLCHHSGDGPEYEDLPFANISRDGRFVAFTRAMGGGRTDFMVVRTTG